MEKPVDQELRYERKFYIEHLDQHQVKAMIKSHPGMFSEIYHPRIINNLYMDSIHFGSFFANVYGISDRMKARVRWYGEHLFTAGNPILEFKIKQGFLGRKVRYPLESFVLDEQFSSAYFRNFIRESELSGDVKATLSDLYPVLLNRYHRSYFQSVDGKFRLTIDADIAFYKINRLRNNFLGGKTDNHSVVLEIKYDSSDDDLVKKITNAFPFRVTRNSKYIQGIEKVWI